MFCLQNNLNLIIHQKGERPLSFSMSPVRAPDVRDHVLVLTIHAKSVPSFIHYWKQILQGGFRHGHRDWYITCIEVTWDCQEEIVTELQRHIYTQILYDHFASIQAIALTEEGFCWTCIQQETELFTQPWPNQYTFINEGWCFIFFVLRFQTCHEYWLFKG